MTEEQEFPEQEQEYEMGESIPKLKIAAIELAIKAVAVSGTTMEPGNILAVARDFYLFIVEEEEENEEDGDDE